MISTRMIIGLSFLTFAAVFGIQSTTAMQSATDGLGISGSSIEFSLWDYNPLTLLSAGRVEKLVTADPGLPKMEPLKFGDVDIGRFDNRPFIGGPSDSSDAHLAGID